MEKTIIVIGGGPAGYAAAIRAAQLGARVTLAEDRDIGGTCLNAGCIPTKALLHTGTFYRAAVSGGVAGVRIGSAALDWPQAQRHKAQLVGRLTGGISALLRAGGVTVRRERAALLSPREVKIGAEILRADAVILAAGSVSARPDFPGAELTLDSAAALSLDAVPKSVVIVGGGVIGVEFATLFHSLGAQVAILELTPRLLPPFDADIAEALRESEAFAGVDVRTGAVLKSVSRSPYGLTAAFEQEGQAQRVHAERVLVAVGRKPNLEGLGLEALGVRLEGGAVWTDEHFQTSLPGLYAAGDCNGRHMLAHAAIAQGAAAAEHIMGAPAHYNPGIIPSCVYSSPEIAAVGLTEQQARETGADCSVGVFSLTGNGKALIEGADGGFVKIIAERRLGQVLGVHIIGPRATELIAQAALCMGMEGTVEDLANTVQAHPTISEAVAEAAMSVFGQALHGL